MYRSSAKSRKSFKPPLRTSGAGVKATVSKEAGDGPSPSLPSKEDVERLKAKETQLDGEIKVLQDKGLKPEHLQEYIDLLHEYNEVKDIAQIFLGRLAIYECVTLKEIARRYNAPESD